MSAPPDAPGRLLPRAVIDTNVFIRALLKSPSAYSILEALLTAKFQLVIAEPLLAELAEVFSRPKFRRVIDVIAARELLALIVERAEVVEPALNPPACRDPDDEIVLAIAIAGKADFIVTGDDDLRADESLRAAMRAWGVELLGVNGFLTRISEEKS